MQKNQFIQNLTFLSLPVILLLLTLSCGKVAESLLNSNNPVANAGADQTVAPNATVTLSASASTDADGNTLTYLWSTTETTITLTNSTSATCTFTAPSVNATTAYTITLVVNDGANDSAADTIVISVNPAAAGNNRPVANAGSAQTVASGATVTLSGSTSTDADSNTLNYTWSEAHTDITLSATSSVTVTFTAPTVNATTNYTFNLVVNDGITNSDTATVSITITPPGAAAAAGTASYSALGDIDTTTGYYHNLSAAQYNGTPYIAYCDTKVIVKKYVAGAWIGLDGGDGVVDSTQTTSTSKDTPLAIDPTDGTPYVAYTDNGIVVKKFTAGAWTQVGTKNVGIATAGSVHRATMVVENGVIYLAMNFLTEFRVAKYDGTWTELDTTTLDSINPDNDDIIVVRLANSVPYIGYTKSSKLSILHYDTTSSTWVADLSDYRASYGNVERLDFIPGTEFKLAVMENDSFTYKIYMRKFTSGQTPTAWDTSDLTYYKGKDDYAGVRLHKIGSSYYISLVNADYNGSTYLRTVVRKYNNTTWETLGDNSAAVKGRNFYDSAAGSDAIYLFHTAEITSGSKTLFCRKLTL